VDNEGKYLGMVCPGCITREEVQAADEDEMETVEFLRRVQSLSLALCPTYPWTGMTLDGAWLVMK